MQTSSPILIVDDDPEIRSLLARYLTGQAFRVQTAANRRESEARIAQALPDLVVLDVMLPDGSGLEIGADDYLGKPFNPRELVARIKAMLRRAGADEPAAEPMRRHRMAGFAIDVELRRVPAPDGTAVELTGAEFDLLRVFLERPGRLLSRDQLLDLTQDRDRDPLDRSIDVLMSRLRRKLDDPSDGPLFKTVRNGGYQLVVPVEAQVVTQ